MNNRGLGGYRDTKDFSIRRSLEDPPRATLREDKEEQRLRVRSNELGRGPLCHLSSLPGKQ